MKRKYSIAVVLPGVGLINRGTENFLLELTERLNNNYDITIFARRELNVNCIKIRAIPRDNTFTNFIHRIPIVKKIINYLCLDPLSIELLTANVSAFTRLYKGQFDMVISLTVVWGAIICRVLRALKKIPFVVVQQCQYSRWEIWSAAQKPDLYVALNSSVQEKISRKFKNLKTTYIPNAVDIEKFVSQNPQNSLDLEHPIFLSVGALEPLKRHDLAIKAVSRLKKGSLLVLGKGELKGDLERLGRKLLGEDGKRFLLKSVSPSEMPMHYLLCDVFTLASSGEGFGIVYLEAMACNKPIVTTSDATRREVVGNAGILCDCANIEEYTEALGNAIQTDFGDKPRRQAEKFRWERVAKKYDEVFQDIINRDYHGNN